MFHPCIALTYKYTNICYHICAVFVQSCMTCKGQSGSGMAQIFDTTDKKQVTQVYNFKTDN